MESAPRNVQVRPLSSSMMVITWEPPETPNGQVTVSLDPVQHLIYTIGCLFVAILTTIVSRLFFKGYKVFFTTNPNQPEASWDSRMVDNSELTTIPELTPHAIYTIRVQAFTSMGAGPLSSPVKVKTQQGKLHVFLSSKVFSLYLISLIIFVFIITTKIIFIPKNVSQ